MACPLCDHAGKRPSWFGSTRYRGREFPYADCLGCGSAYCDPMPDDATVAMMYGSEYTQAPGGDPALDNPKQPDRVVGWLKGLGGGTFVDYGCGPGELLVKAAGLNWDAVGLELDGAVARETEARTGVRVVTALTDLLGDSGPLADVLHLGDVIEHLNDLGRQFPAILRLLRPGGVLLAQGPLEAGPTLFTWLLRQSRKARGSRPTELGPYHVLLATVTGQRAFFRRFPLVELEYSVHEVSWPAPSRLTLSDARRPRNVTLYAASRVSRLISSLRPGAWGNRYFYAGQVPEALA